MNSYEKIRANRVEGGIYAAAAKMEVSIQAHVLRISCTALKRRSRTSSPARVSVR